MIAREPVLVAMSGGVDSSVAAALLVKRGYDVIGVTMQIWQESQTDPRHAGCCSLGAVEDARRVARVLGIPHYVVNFREEFRETVIQNFVDEYGAGRTPNPCVECNRTVKFEMLLDKMHEFGCGRLVTGHYARIRKDRAGRYRLMRARGGGKDQSYVLYMLGQDQLKHAWFPLGEYESKDRIRAMAAEFGLSVANKPDSQEICFVSEAGGYSEFLRARKPEMFSDGDIVDPSGERVGSHGGVATFTVGQRKGIGLTARNGRPLFVLRLDAAENRVVVGHEEDLLAREVPLEEVVWSAVSQQDGPRKVEAKIRYNMLPQPATLHGDVRPRLVFDDPVRAVTPGQIAVAYIGRTVAAGGVISGS